MWSAQRRARLDSLVELGGAQIFRTQVCFLQKADEQAYGIATL